MKRITNLAEALSLTAEQIEKFKKTEMIDHKFLSKTLGLDNDQIEMYMEQMELEQEFQRSSLMKRVAS